MTVKCVVSVIGIGNESAVQFPDGNRHIEFDIELNIELNIELEFLCIIRS